MGLGLRTSLVPGNWRKALERTRSGFAAQSLSSSGLSAGGRTSSTVGMVPGTPGSFSKAWRHLTENSRI